MSQNNRNSISWVPTAYFAIRLPFVALHTMPISVFKDKGTNVIVTYRLFRRLN